MPGPAFAAFLAGLAVAAAPGGQQPPSVQVTQEAGQGSSGMVTGQVDIDAPPQTVWQVLLDCPDAPKLMVSLKSCRVIDRDPQGRWDVREQISRATLLPSVRTVVRADYDPPYEVHFHRVDGDLKVLDGEWRLEPTDGGQHTRLFYQSRVTANFFAPGMIVRAILRHDMPITLNNLRAECEKEAEASRQ